MSKQTDSSLLIVSSVPALYQRLLAGVVSYQELGNRVLQQIKAAHAFRQVEQVRALARLLVNIPMREFQLIAQYYLVWCKCRESEYHSEILERIIEQTQTHKAQALLSRGTFELSQGNPEQALYFYTEGLRTAPAISSYIGLTRAIAVLKAREGFHESALRDMESLIPQIRHAEPRLYYDFLNSYAVELIEAGRTGDAESVAALAVSSPFGPYYPEWRETLSEARSKRKRRSTVRILQPQIEQEYKTAIEPEGPDLRIQTVIDSMMANLHRRIALAEFARLVNLSSSHLSHLFKTQTGLSPGEYLIRLRMEKAGQLVAGSFLAIKEIMAATGHQNKSNFTRQFKKHFAGLTPSQYRKRAFAR